MPPYREIVETALPPFLILGMQQRMCQLGYPQTPGVIHVFRQAVRSAFARVPMHERILPESIVKGVANTITRGMSPPGDVRDMLMVVLSFTPLLAENGLHGTLADPRPALCLQELNDFALLARWRMNTAWITGEALRILGRARLEGYYLDDGFERRRVDG